MPMPPPPTAEDEEGVKDIMEIDMLSILEEEKKSENLFDEYSFLLVLRRICTFSKKVGNTEPFFPFIYLVFG